MKRTTPNENPSTTPGTTRNVLNVLNVLLALVIGTLVSVDRLAGAVEDPLDACRSEKIRIIGRRVRDVLGCMRNQMRGGRGQPVDPGPSRFAACVQESVNELPTEWDRAEIRAAEMGEDCAGILSKDDVRALLEETAGDILEGIAGGIDLETKSGRSLGAALVKAAALRAADRLRAERSNIRRPGNDRLIRSINRAVARFERRWERAIRRAAAREVHYHGASADEIGAILGRLVEGVVRFDTSGRVAHFMVPAGRERHVSPGFEIVASDGIEIAGDLIIHGTGSGDVRLTAEDGDIVVSGRILVLDEGASADREADHEADGAGSRSHRLAATRASPGPRPGVSIILTASAPNRNIILKRSTLLQSGRGQDAPRETIVSPSSIRHVGTQGARGGDIVLRALLGTIRLPRERRSGDPALFGLGDGGHGAGILVDRTGFDTGETSIELIGGRGGDSGRLVFEAFTVEGVPDRSELPNQPVLIEGGAGGRGGNVLWDNTERGRLGQPGRVLKRTCPLREILVQGGDGGDGARVGGRGGRAVYWSARVINEHGDPIAAAGAHGGRGGDVFPSPVPLHSVLGGEGGEVSVAGNFGWDGDARRRDGAAGGDVLGQGGNGGDVLNGVVFLTARGGPGGNGDGAVMRMVRELSSGERDDSFFRSPRYGVVSGNGGRGYGDCEGCWGGDGGNSGLVQAFGGRGGSVLPSLDGGWGGRGGNLWLVDSGLPGIGGDGNPPGKGGCVSTRIAEPGPGGTGKSGPGEPGRERGYPVTSDGECVDDGNLCGEELECTLGGEGDPGTGGCLENGSIRIGASYAARLAVHGESGTETWEESGVWTCRGPSDCGWEMTLTYPEHGPDGIVYKTVTGFSASPPVDASPARRANRPRCAGGQILWPGEGVYTQGDMEFSFTGCTEILGLASCLGPADHRCVNENDTTHIRQISPGTCRPYW